MQTEKESPRLAPGAGWYLVKSGKNHSTSDTPRRAFPEFERRLELRWLINQDPLVCVYDKDIRAFLSEFLLRKALCKRLQQGDLDGKWAETLSYFAAGYWLVSRFAAAAKLGSDLGTYELPIGATPAVQFTRGPGIAVSELVGKNHPGISRTKMVKTSIPGLKGKDIRKSYQKLRELSDFLSPEPYRAKEHLRTRVIRAMVQELVKNSYERVQAYGLVAGVFEDLKKPLTEKELTDIGFAKEKAFEMAADASWPFETVSIEVIQRASFPRKSRR